ncbi:hypothetical protein LWI29_028868 [Acer saccharum]|uniref:Uncharacterized protein n=1 Tax=Acer saccharum TaxID=4024 RepID=A0AA39VEG9_ACESA|nr:hypothetical protein LWI29_028868 [Acer saccharum]
MECANDIVKYTIKVNSQCVYSFLVGLDPQLYEVRGRVLATKPLPNIQAVYAMVCAEANRQDAMLGGKIEEGAVMASQKMPTSKKDRKCTHCNGIGHTVDAYFRLHGYPEWHPKGKKASQMSSNNKEEDINPQGNLATTPGFIAKLGMYFTGNSDWIIDSGATDHMTCDRYREFKFTVPSFMGESFEIGRFTRDLFSLKDLWDCVMHETLGLQFTVGDKYHQ